MEDKHQMPRGPIVDGRGEPNLAGRPYLEAVEKMSNVLNALHALTNLDGGTSYTADQLRDKIIEILNAAKT